MGDAAPMRSVALAFVLSTLTALPAAGAPGDAEAPHRVPRATSEIVIDGVIDEPAWDNALSLDLDYEVRPGENTEPPVRTVVFITYDERNVLVAFRAFDPEPGKIRARFRDRDKVWGDDWVGIVLDTFNDQRRAYEFWVNPHGIQTDGIYSEGQGGDGRNFDSSWDAIWRSAGRLTDLGYEVEMAIPFNQIRFQGTDGPRIWGFDATRSWPRSDRVHIGLFPRDRGANSYLAQEEQLIGFEGVSPGRNLELAPTLAGFAHEERPDFPDSMKISEQKDLQVGATATWGITPNITLTGALNPDFSQIEADAVQLGLNERFELFFNEKRPFFLESADYFDTGVDLLYTRMIADPLAALKVTGKMGRHTVGVIAASDEVTNLIVPGVEGSDSGAFDSTSTALVGRYRYDLGSDSAAGVLVTDRRGSGGYFNQVASVDALLRPTASDSFSVNAGWSSTRYSKEMQSEIDLPEIELSDHALRLVYAHTARSWFARANYSDLGNDFRADLGFITQVGFREAEAAAGYTWWGDDDSWYNRLEMGGHLGWTRKQNGDLLGERASVWLQGEGPLQSSIHVEAVTRTEVSEGVRFDGLFSSFFFFRVRPSASFGFRGHGVIGDAIDYVHTRPGSRVRLRGELDFSLGRHLTWEISHLYTTLDVEGGRLFEANVPESTVIWQFNNRTFVRAILQYTDIRRDQDLYEDDVDELDRDFFVQFLFSYKVNPRTVLFAGYSEAGAENETIAMTTTSRAVFLKIGYAWLW